MSTEINHTEHTETPTDGCLAAGIWLSNAITSLQAVKDPPASVRALIPRIHELQLACFGLGLSLETEPENMPEPVIDGGVEEKQ